MYMGCLVLSVFKVIWGPSVALVSKLPVTQKLKKRMAIERNVVTFVTRKGGGADTTWIWGTLDLLVFEVI